MLSERFFGLINDYETTFLESSQCWLRYVGAVVIYLDLVAHFSLLIEQLSIVSFKRFITISVLLIAVPNHHEAAIKVSAYLRIFLVKSFKGVYLEALSHSIRLSIKPLSKNPKFVRVLSVTLHDNDK